MPTYNYRCSNCNQEFELFHSMSEVAEDCDACNSRGTLVKQVSTMARVIKRAPNAANKPGKLVKQYIEDVKQDIKEEKQRLKTQEHKG